MRKPIIILIINYLLLFFQILESNYILKTIHDQGLTGVFDNDADVVKIVSIIDNINENATVA
jgi:hypothetical protein